MVWAGIQVSQLEWFVDAGHEACTLFFMTAACTIMCLTYSSDTSAHFRDVCT